MSPLRIITELLQYLCWCCSSVDDVPFTQYGGGVIAFAGCADPLVRFQLVSWVYTFEPTFPTALATNPEQHQGAGFLHLVSFRKNGTRRAGRRQRPLPPGLLRPAARPCLLSRIERVRDGHRGRLRLGRPARPHCRGLRVGNARADCGSHPGVLPPY